ncbi:hypothetical protein E1265_29215 [Streptomyces sp. 8K308]|uniref:hypothetical protein n=1 Tax=Streptomyces sp. 8K308 TaxID=2530388 RepID=UPI0010528591|nr:hypothetical protein [Streptomyces sp. 8K308]TDC12790.1 hypothetical protein E1265_29215 [Streptomyces sp. 8K308]
MRNDLETREIADTELDAVAGGVAGLVSVSGGLVGALTSDVSNAVGSLETVGFVQGVAGQVTGQVSGITGVHANTGAVTGLAGL